jgi:catechol 2,3-dioxygenase-like lactoylglutathione lyase family enzyme
MMKSIHPVRVNHLNIVVQDFDRSIDHLRELYGAEFLLDMPQREWHAGLIQIGRVIFELFVPHDFLLNARYGAHYVGIEYQADMQEVREAIAAHGIRIVRDIGVALHTDPADCFGIAFEFYSGSFHDNDWKLLGGKMKSAEHWRAQHPLGLTGLKGYTVAVGELDAAVTFFQSFLGAQVMHESTRPAISARAISLQVADAVVELIAPMGDGSLRQHLHRFADGIYSTVFATRDIQQVRRYFAERGVELIAGTAPNRLAVRAAANPGILFEFSE